MIYIASFKSNTIEHIAVDRLALKPNCKSQVPSISDYLCKINRSINRPNTELRVIRR